MSDISVWSEPAIESIAAIVHSRTGLVFPANRQGVAEAGIRRAMARLGVGSLDQYRHVVSDGGAALDDLVAELTIGETYFFREPAQLEFVRNEVLPDIQRRHGPEHTIRMWSAACSSGEEPYTLAIMMREAGLHEHARIVGTEISRPRLAAARRGDYRKWSLRGVPDDVVRNYFSEREQRYVLKPEIRAAVEFRYLNLAEDVYPASSTGIWGMDLILCRNVLIYFDTDAIQFVATRLMKSLCDGGWLLLGASDPMLVNLVPCEVVVTGAGLAYRRPARRAVFPVRAGIPHAPAPAARAKVADVSQRVRGPSQPATAPALVFSGLTVSQLDHMAERYSARDYEGVIDLGRQLLTASNDGARTSDARAWILVVRALANTGRLEEAGVACAAALDRHRTSAELIYLHSLLLAESGRAAEAAVAARRALYLDRTMIVAHMALGTVLSRAGNAAGARRAFANALDLLAELPPDAVVPFSDGESAFRLIEIARAQASMVAGAVA